MKTLLTKKVVKKTVNLKVHFNYSIYQEFAFLCLLKILWWKKTPIELTKGVTNYN